MKKTVKLFANTGLQYVSCGEATETIDNWQTVKSRNLNLQFILEKTFNLPNGNQCIVYAIDTSTGPVQKGFFAESEDVINNPIAPLKYDDSDELELNILASSEGAAEPIDSALVLDFGNCRCMGLVVDKISSGDELPVHEFELFENDDALYIANSVVPDSLPVSHLPSKSFDSRVEFRPAEFKPYEYNWEDSIETKIPVAKSNLKNAFKSIISKFTRKEADFDTELKIERKTKLKKESSPLFGYYSQVRLGEKNCLRDEASHRDPNMGIETLTGMSSPKRYIWDSERLKGRKWFQINPKHYETETTKGYYFRYQPEDDYNWKSIEELPHDSLSTKNPKPLYPRRSMMTAAIYEILCKFNQYINSLYFRRETPTPLQKRNFTDLVITFPSGMHQSEKEQYKKQIIKALNIFQDTVFHYSKNSIQLDMFLDEGSAGQIAYAYGEAKMFNSASRWVQAVGRNNRVRIANIDIGGGTTDLMIGDYMPTGTGSSLALEHRTLHVDGISRGGDNIVQKLLEATIIPKICQQLGIDLTNALKLFKSKGDSKVRRTRNSWISKLFYPLAKGYLNIANNPNNESMEIDLDKVPNFNTNWKSFIRDVETILSKTLNATAVVDIKYNENEFKQVVFSVYNHILDHFCSVVTKSNADILLLSGKGSDLSVLKSLIKELTPLPPSRVVFLGGYYTGEWCPFDTDKPGEINDPKSVVSIGSALSFLCRNVGVHNFHLNQINDNGNIPALSFWGQITKQRPHFLNDHSLFSPNSSENEATLSVHGDLIFLGRRTTSSDKMEVYPTYVINISKDYLSGVSITFERNVHGKTETLTIKQLRDVNDNLITDNNAVQMKLRTMFDESFFLDDFLNIDEQSLADVV